jgi:signal peptidase II
MRRRLPKFTVIAIGAALVALFDQLSKRWIMATFAFHETRPFGPYFSLTYVHNTGSAFGLFQGNNTALLVIGFVILGVLFYSARGIAETGGFFTAFGLSLVLGGAIGNIIDRIALGHVVDFLDFHFWPVFNLADSAISVGAASIAIGLLRREEPR